MQRSSIPMGVGSLKKWQEKGTLNFDLPYQRHAGVWSPFQKSMLVYSIFRDSYIPPLVFLKFTDGESPVDSVLDGQQRLTTLTIILSYPPTRNKTNPLKTIIITQNRIHLINKRMIRKIIFPKLPNIR